MDKLIILLLLFSLSCSRNNSLIKKINKRYPIVNSELNWKIESRRLNKDINEHLLFTNSEDTTFAVTVLEEKNHMNLIFIKRFYDAQGYNTVWYGTDGLKYHYIQDKKDEGGKFFIIGEYEYKFHRQLFSEQEELFYLQNRDSLRFIKGNNLPSFLVEKSK